MRLICSMIVAGWFALIGFPIVAQVQAMAPAEKGVEVLARGPVHEAFAEPGTTQTEPSPIIPKQPPEPIEELPPDQKPEGDNVEWIPGYWSWDEERADFIWVSGFWRVPPPGRDWVPGAWRPAANGWQWVAGLWRLEQQAELTYLPPPPATIEAGPVVPAPSETHVYVPGCWVYRERYIWRPGFWLPHRPGWVWVPAHYRWSPVGFVFIDGYWDYPLANRGVLFAPVALQPVVYTQPAFVYRPTYVVCEPALIGSLFVRPATGQYFFGDYFDPRYRAAGFSTWFNVGHVGIDVAVDQGPRFDPLYGYYRNVYRDGGWDTIQGVYVGRFNGSVPRPPRTVVQQNTVVQNITNTTINNVVVNNTTINKTDLVRNVTMVAPLTQVDHRAVRLQPVAPQQSQAYLQSANNLRDAGQQRVRAEQQLVAQGPPRNRPGDAPRVVKLDVPQRPERRPTAILAPPPPVKPSTPIGIQRPSTPMPTRPTPTLNPNGPPSRVNRPEPAMMPRVERPIPGVGSPAPNPQPRPWGEGPMPRINASQGASQPPRLIPQANPPQPRPAPTQRQTEPVPQSALSPSPALQPPTQRGEVRPSPTRVPAANLSSPTGPPSQPQSQPNNAMKPRPRPSSSTPGERFSQPQSMPRRFDVDPIASPTPLQFSSSGSPPRPIERPAQNRPNR